jgi:lipid-binding SYLF domain-containing protein
MKTQPIACLLALSAAVALAAPASARDPARTIDSSSAVLKEFLDLQLKQIPAGLLADAHGVAIVPNVIKVGLVVGGQRGHGVVIVREKDGSWRAPTFMTLTGGSIGWQIGAQATDFVLVFKTQKSVDGLLKGKFTIGADAAAAAGPVGRRAGAATDGQLKAEIYTYSRSRGLFAGVSLDGSVIEIDNDANGAYYGATRPGEAIPAPPEAAVALTQLVAQLAAHPERIEGRPVPDAASSGPLPTPALPRNSLEGPALGPALPNPTPALPNPTLPATAEPTITRAAERSLIVPAPAEGGQIVLDLTQPAAPLADAADVQRELARSARQLHLLIDKNWQRYLELPDEVYREGKRPSAKELKAAADRFDKVAADPRYAALAERPEFQATQGLLHAYLDTLDARNSSKLPLPPPPSGNR